MTALRILSTGIGLSVQDRGRFGWRHCGVPTSGAMDPHAAQWANRLLGNDDFAPVLELALQGAALEVVTAGRLAVTGANAGIRIPSWQADWVHDGEVIDFPQNRGGIWTYLATDGGWDTPRWLGSHSEYPRAGIGKTWKAGDVIRGMEMKSPPAMWHRAWVDSTERRDYSSPPALRVWKGPQWDAFDSAEHDAFLNSEWEVSSRSDRVGYRLEGARLNSPSPLTHSEPVLVGSVQIPPNGQPIVTMRDGPTVGGYPKIASVEVASLARLAQCAPGVKFRWELQN